MTLRALLRRHPDLALRTGVAAAPAAARPAPGQPPAPPMVFYVVKGAPDACGRGCDSWIAAEGQIDAGGRAALPEIPGAASGIAICRSISPRPAAISTRRWRWARCCANGPWSPGWRAPWCRECGFEAQNGEVCLKLKQSGRELHGDLWTRGAMCNSACPYLILGATTREIAPDAVLAVHSPKVVVHFRGGGVPTRQMRAAATERGPRTRRSHAAQLYRQDGRRYRVARSRAHRSSSKTCTS